jgi:hypothetical protein
MQKTYRILSKMEMPRVSHADFLFPRTIYTLIEADEQRIRVSLPRRSDWEVGMTVRIEESVVLASLVQ